ncbi:MAG: 2'-5' RNA ligase family protein [Methanomicrobiaceae archaeon]|uniref:Uncharacterized protein n=1 Tax=hydrocarbon metagenome TaxID=938273 RepID=A0A0W8FJ26_9ZZZZ|nr:2'-5' RNA ligase family protein [Methanomicrobiaceae archaeon]MDD5419159.1 2'-5' RNA ligase family protein [Methanomicrobiaceae archaeon]
MTIPDEAAIDVVLLPPEPIMEEAIRINQALQIACPDQEIVLDNKTCIPHITVAMAAVRSGNLPAIARELERIVGKCSPLPLSITGIETHTTGSGEKIAGFVIRRTDALQLFHKTVVSTLRPYALSRVEQAMFARAPGEAVTESSLDCVRRFFEHSSFGHYSPHITLGFGELAGPLPGLSFPLQFHVPKAAVCHLGNHCTCRAILHSVTF